MGEEIDVVNELVKEINKHSENRKKIEEDIELEKEWKKRAENICKPCWELKYCPYGTLVEQFPLLPTLRKDAVEHNEFLKEQLKKGKYQGVRKELFEKKVANFNSEDYPEKMDKEQEERSCIIFGHLCPVFFVNEPFTETKEMRRVSRNIPREIMLRIVRRDNYTCQICGKHLKDDEMEFDHIIPISKGGSSEENNIRLTCFKCNRSKSNKKPDFVE